MDEDNTPTRPKKRARTRLQHIRVDTARRLRWRNVRYKARRRKADKPIDDLTTREATSVGLAPPEYFEIAPRVPKLKKNQLARPPPLSSSMVRYAKRQRDKTWLPTHIWHAKRAHMTSNTKWSHRRLGKVIRSSKNGVSNPGNKFCTGGVDGALWRFAVPLAPTVKCYRSIHRSSGMRGAVVWDSSYFNTIGVEGSADGIDQVLREIGVDGKSTKGAIGRKWKNGTRSWSGWVFERRQGDDKQPQQPIAPATIVWCAEEKQAKEEDVEMTDASPDLPSNANNLRPPFRKLFIRVHPSAFLQLWIQLLPLCQAQKPQVTLQDLRFEIGSIDIMGPGATEALLSALKPVEVGNEPSPESTWSRLSPALTNPASLPQNVVLGFNISDPRLRFPPKKSTKKPAQPTETETEELTRLLASWPSDSNPRPGDLFDRTKRLAAQRTIPSQKAINRRQAQAGPGKYPEPRQTDPHIPILILVSRSPPSTSPSCSTPTTSTSASSADTGTYTVLVPWRFIPAIFNYLVSYPLSTGNTPAFAGLNQQRQIAFETGTAWFPGDFPGTKAGWEWGLKEDAERKWQWEKRPKGRRMEFDSLDLGTVGRGHGAWEGKVGGQSRKGEIGNGWSCDWRRLIYGESLQSEKEDDNDVEMATADSESAGSGEKRAAESDDSQHIQLPLDIHHLTPSLASSILSQYLSLPFKGKSTITDPPIIPSNSLATVRILMLTNRGSPSACARIYRLPTTDPALRECWMQTLRDQYTLLSTRKSRSRGTNSNELTGGNPDDLDNISAGAIHLPMPEEADLIGFVTTGNYNLRIGQGTGVGCLYVNRLLDGAAEKDETLVSAGSVPGMAKAMFKRLCIVRNAGDNAGRFGLWEVV